MRVQNTEHGEQFAVGRLSCRRRPSTVLCLLSSGLWLTGCSTISQHAVAPAATLAYIAPIKVANGYLIDATFRDRYNALIAIYGAKKLEDGAPVFVPALRRDDGITIADAAHWLMTAAAMDNMVTLSALKRRGAAP